jgi:SAM-dependent methyltransferase
MGGAVENTLGLRSRRSLTSEPRRKIVEHNPKEPGTNRWQPDYVRTHFAEQAGYLATVSATDVLQQVAAQAEALLNLKSGNRVLEVGCGSGVFLPRLAEKVQPNGQVVGLDHSDALVVEARKSADASQYSDAITVDLGDAYKLPYPSSTFDAAHCERVLMHLADPTAAVREMARVVRPGGVVVAAEPDWAGARFDHPDQEALRLVYLRALSMRNVDVGLTLNRRFAECGLVNRRFAPVIAAFDNFSSARMFGLKMEPAVDTLVEEGALSEARLRAVIPTLEQASSDGTYYAVIVMHIVAGVVPS